MGSISIAVTLLAVALLVVVPCVLHIRKGAEGKHEISRTLNSILAGIVSFRDVEIGRVLLNARWLLVPFYLGIVSTIAIYLFKFLKKLFLLFSEVGSLSDKDLMLQVLYLVDIVMVANLLLYTAIGSFSYFVRRIDVTGEDRPALLGHLDATTLKVKLGMALIGVSSIHLLEAFMDSANVSVEQLTKLIAIHATFVLSTLVIAWIRTLPPENHSEHK